MSEIVIKNLSKSYDDKKIIDNFSLTVKNGERIAFMAPSGYGKTTLLRLLLGLEKPDGGEIIGVSDNVAVVFQEDRLSEDFSVKTNIRFTKSKSCTISKIDDVLKSLKLEDSANKAVKYLSGGMKRRVAIARALCIDFNILIMDEPFEGLDLSLKDDIIKYLDLFCKNKTVLLVTHDIAEAQALGCKIVSLNK